MNKERQIMNGQVRRIVALLFAGWCVIWIYRTLMGAVHPEIMETVGKQSSMRLGLISSFYFVGYVAMQIPGGFIMDRFGKWQILVPSFGLMALGFLIVGLAKNIETIYAGSLLSGIGSGTYYSGAFSLSTENVPAESKCFATAIVNSGCALGMLMGYLFSAGAVRQLGVDWRAMLFLLAIMGALMAIVIRPLSKSERIEGRAATHQQRVDFKQIKTVLFTPRIMCSYFFYFCTCYGYYMIVSWLPSFLQNERCLPGVLAGYTSSVIALVSIPSALFLGRAADHFVKKRTIFLTVIQLLSGIMLACITCLRPFVFIVLSIALYGIVGKQAIDPLIVSQVTEQFSNVALSTGLGVFNFFGMSASIVAPMVTGVINDVTGSRTMGFFIAVGLLIVSSLVFGLTNRRTK